ncbi:uncharacterized protein LOC134854682 [Symsagittifera roscoffensis]|uniref:uncharacterized protein LOC134854682 n=1 Tax=Symsagittifera roscoffensis TaxID=84072 RepID=UPI00307C30E9
MLTCNCQLGSGLFPSANQNYQKPRNSKKMKMTQCWFSFVFISFTCATLVQGDVLPSYRQLPLPESSYPPLHHQSSVLQVGAQPQVQNLLANEPNCSRWIWGQCYYNHGMCGEGKQHATRSGDGCRIIGITSRCFKACKPQELLTPNNPRMPHAPKCIWGVDCEREEIPALPPPQNNYKDPYISMMPGEDNRDESERNIKPNIPQMDHPEDREDSREDKHCRWHKAKWGKCVNGQKFRVRKLRHNRSQNQAQVCPSMKRDTKACGGGSMSGNANAKPIAGRREFIDLDFSPSEVKQFYPDELIPLIVPAEKEEVSSDYTRDAPCKWDQSVRVRKCGKCIGEGEGEGDNQKGEMTCTLPLLSGNPNTCGTERKMQISCEI